LRNWTCLLFQESIRVNFYKIWDILYDIKNKKSAIKDNRNKYIDFSTLQYSLDRPLIFITFYIWLHENNTTTHISYFLFKFRFLNSPYLYFRCHPNNWLDTKKDNTIKKRGRIINHITERIWPIVSMTDNLIWRIQQRIMSSARHFRGNGFCYLRNQHGNGFCY
jgi:hypothetical protein